MALVDCGQDTAPGNVIEQHQARHDLGRPVSALLPHRPEVVADEQVSQRRILHYTHRVQLLDVVLRHPGLLRQLLELLVGQLYFKGVVH